MIGDQDLSIFFQDCDLVQRTNGRPDFKGHVEYPEVVEGFGSPKASAAAARLVMTYETAAAPDLVHDEIVVVSGTQYKIRSPRKDSDGMTSVADLAKVL